MILCAAVCNDTKAHTSALLIDHCYPPTPDANLRHYQLSTKNLTWTSKAAELSTTSHALETDPHQYPQFARPRLWAGGWRRGRQLPRRTVKEMMVNWRKWTSGECSFPSCPRSFEFAALSCILLLPMYVTPSRELQVLVAKFKVNLGIGVHSALGRQVVGTSIMITAGCCLGGHVPAWVTAAYSNLIENPCSIQSSWSLEPVPVHRGHGFPSPNCLPNLSW